MKTPSFIRILLIATLILFSGLIGSSQVVNIPDANFKAALLANTAINTNADGEIQLTEATAYAGSINLSGKSITDLTGIESFTALIGLDCRGNQLTTLNVSTNTALTHLYCNNNQLTTLDVSGATALTYLHCYNNQLTTLDVSTNTALTELYCNNNQLTTLNVKNGNNTKIYSYDVNNNPNLTCIQVDDAAWSTANWPHKDTWATYSESCPTAINEFNNKNIEVSIYPNPNKGNFELEILNSKLGIKNAELIIYNVLGEIVYQTEIQNSKFKNFKSGVYVLQLQSEQGVVSQKIIVQ